MFSVLFEWCFVGDQFLVLSCFRFFFCVFYVFLLVSVFF